MAMSAVAALTARGVWDTWISSRERLACVENAKEREGQTSRCAGCDIDVIVTGTIMANVFQ
jgi:hypothetical protein